MSKNIYLIAGAEGCGKTTFIKNLAALKQFEGMPIICSDMQAEFLDKNLSYSERKKLAADISKKTMQRLVEQNKSFILESPLYDRAELSSLKSFNAFGYTLRTVYIATSVPVINERRIKKRALISGEPPINNLRDLYRKSMKNIKPLIEISGEILIYDGSDADLKKVYSKTATGEEWIDDRYKVISWVNEFIPGVFKG